MPVVCGSFHFVAHLTLLHQCCVCRLQPLLTRCQRRPSSLMVERTLCLLMAKPGRSVPCASCGGTLTARLRIKSCRLLTKSFCVSGKVRLCDVTFVAERFDVLLRYSADGACWFVALRNKLRRRSICNGQMRDTDCLAVAKRMSVCCFLRQVTMCFVFALD